MTAQINSFGARCVLASLLIGIAFAAAAQDKSGTYKFIDNPAPSQPTVNQSATAGAVDAGNYAYLVTFVTAAGEIQASTPATVKLDHKSQAEITNIPRGLSSVTARKIYRSKRTQNGERGEYYLLTTINDNTSTEYTDNTPDARLGSATFAAPQVSGTDPLVLNRSLVFIKEPAPKPFTAQPGAAGNVDVGKHEYSVTFVTANGETDGSVDGVDDHSPSAAGVPVTVSGSARQVLLTNIPLGSRSVVARKIWRSRVKAPLTETEKYYLLATLTDNTTTSYTDNTADARLGAEGRLLHDNSTAGVFKVGTTAAGFIGELNTSFGFFTTPANSVGEVNTVFGARSAPNNVGDGNSFFGYEAGLGQTTGLLNAGFGLQAVSKNQTGSRNTGLGNEALMHAGESGTTAENNTAVGNEAMFLPRGVVDNVAIGVNAMRGEFTSTGSQNIGIGVSALRSFSTGAHNTVVGWSAFGNLTTGANNVGIGFQAGSRAVGASKNTFVGTNAGRGAAAGSSGSENTAVGMEAGAGLTTGGSNSLVGFSSGNGISTGAQNSALGLQSLNGTTSGSDNVGVGVNAGATNTSGKGNTLVGASADVGSNNLNHATAIGAGAVVTQSDSLVLGNNVSVGIGTSAPKAKLEVTGGHILIGTPGQGIVLKSPDGRTCKLLALDNAGAFSASPIKCP